MKIFVLEKLYPRFLGNFATQNPEHASFTYSEYVDKLQNFGWMDAWQYWLSKLGHETWEVIANAEQMQKAWADENGIRWQETSWEKDIAFEQIKSFSPDVLYADDIITFDPQWIQYLRDNIPSIKKVITWCGAPWDQDKQYKCYDLLFSNIPDVVKTFSSAGLPSVFQRHGFDSRALPFLSKELNPSINVSFIGSFFKHAEGHLKRIEWMKELLSQVDVRIFSDIEIPSFSTRSKYILRKVLFCSLSKLNLPSIPTPLLHKLSKDPSLFWNTHFLDLTIIQHTKKARFGFEMLQTLRNSKITLNNHIDLSSTSASNVRLFEATGAGSCLLTDWKDDINEIFEIDREIVTYRTTDECVEKIRWLLSHPNERETIALAGQKRTLKDHSYEQRSQTFLSAIQKLF